jgi:hypothetical protein
MFLDCPVRGSILGVDPIDQHVICEWKEKRALADADDPFEAGMMVVSDAEFSRISFQ